MTRFHPHNGTFKQISGKLQNNINLYQHKRTYVFYNILSIVIDEAPSSWQYGPGHKDEPLSNMNQDIR